MDAPTPRSDQLGALLSRLATQTDQHEGLQSQSTKLREFVEMEARDLTGNIMDHSNPSLVSTSFSICENGWNKTPRDPPRRARNPRCHLNGVLCVSSSPCTPFNALTTTSVAYLGLTVLIYTPNIRIPQAKPSFGSRKPCTYVLGQYVAIQTQKSSVQEFLPSMR